MTMHVALHIKANMVGLYINRRNGGRSNISAPDCVENERRTHKDYYYNVRRMC